MTHVKELVYLTMAYLQSLHVLGAENRNFNFFVFDTNN